MSDVADGPEMSVTGRRGPLGDRAELGDRLGDRADHLARIDHADVQIGDEAQYPPSLVRSG